MPFLQSMVKMLPDAIAQGLIWGILALGVFITYKLLDFSDLTVDGSICTGGAVAALMILNGLPVPLAMAAAFCAGGLAGLITAVLNTRMGIPPILSGILTQLALYSVNLRIMGWGTDAGTQATLPVSVDKFPLVVSSRFVRELGIKNPILMLMILTAVVIGILYWFFGTEVGCSIRATGANQNMARAQGINTNVNKVVGLMVSNGLVALAGGLLAQYQGSATIDMGRGAIVIGLAAVIIGEVVFSKIFHNFALLLLSCTFGAIIYYIVIQFVLRLGLSTTDLKMLTAVVVAIFLAVPYLKGRYFSKSSKARASRHA